MLTKADAAQRVARGAALLDRVRPGWVNEIDIGRLALKSCARCVLGQLFGDFWGGVDAYFRAPFAADGIDINAHEKAAEHGFALGSVFLLEEDDGDICGTFDHGYERLQDAWIDAIAARFDPVEALAPEGQKTCV